MLSLSRKRDLGFYIERMKFIVTPLRYDVILGKSWKNKHKATIHYSNNYVNFKHAGNEYIIHANKTIKETFLGSLMNDYKNGCPIFSILLRNETDNYSDSMNKKSSVGNAIWVFNLLELKSG